MQHVNVLLWEKDVAGTAVLLHVLLTSCRVYRLHSRLCALLLSFFVEREFAGVVKDRSIISSSITADRLGQKLDRAC